MALQKLPWVSGITPAYAGTTLRSSASCRSAWDHPRIRGNHWISPSTRRRPAGSPPHTREPRQDRGRGDRVAGITPAYAGTTGSSAFRGVGLWDHPRIRGNHLHVLHQVLRHPGSPPHTREPLIEGVLREIIPRITPAYAGTTCSRDSFFKRGGDHPRIRGNHRNFCLCHASPPGSPPHTREPQRPDS